MVVVDPRILPLKFGQKRVSNSWYIVGVVIVVVDVFVVILVYVVAVDPRNQPLKFGQNHISNSWDIDDIEFLVLAGDGVVKSFSCQTQLLLGLVQLSCGWVGVVTITIPTPHRLLLNVTVLQFEFKLFWSFIEF